MLLDTHVWLWGLLQPERLPAHVRDVLAGPGVARHLSPISVWETMVLARRRRLRIDNAPEAWVGHALRASGTTMVPITHAIALRSETLEDLTSRDPADRFLVATALEHELTMVTADATLLGYDPLPTLDCRQ